MKRVLWGLAALTLLAGGVRAARADFVAYNTGDSVGNQNYPGNLGLDFNVNPNRPIAVTALGAFDSGQDGFAGPITVSLYRRPAADPNVQGPGTLITSLTLSGTSGVLVGDYRFAALAAPVVLQPGYYSIDAVGFSGRDLNGNENISGFSVTTNNGGGLLSFVGTGRFDGNTVADYPAQSSADQGFGNLSPEPFGAGSFQYASAPEPTSLTLLGVGLFAGAGYGWRKRRCRAASL